MRMGDFFTSLFQLDRENRQRRYGYAAGVISIIVNIILSLVKFIMGMAVNSISLITDSIHSLSDVATSLVVIIGFRISTKLPDHKHPFGHGRAERVVSIIIACMLIIVGFEFFIQGFHRMRNPVPVEFRWFVVLVLLTTVVCKEWLARFTFKLGRKIDSSALRADAWHHRADAVSTVLVIIGFIMYRFGLYYVDGILSILIACFIVYTGLGIIKESSSFLIGEAPSASFINRIKMIALKCDGINDVHHIHVHDYGGKYEITVHIRLKPDTLLDEAHKKATEVEECIKEFIEGAEVTVHVEPEGDDGHR